MSLRGHPELDAGNEISVTRLTPLLVDGLQQPPSEPMIIEVTSGAIARGGTSVVLKGVQLYVEANETPKVVALKVFTDIPKNKEVDYDKRVSNEIEHVRKAIHPNILPCLGVARHDTYTILVTEFMDNGHLLEYFEKNPRIDKQLLVMQVARAVDYLHVECNVVHGDLKCENVLVDHLGFAKLTDFGLSTLVDKPLSSATTAPSIRELNTLHFAAPELLIDEAKSPTGRTRSKTTESDVFAFGRLVLQAFSGTLPWPTVTNYVLFVKVLNNEIPAYPERAWDLGLTGELWSLCLECWKLEPAARPTMTWIVGHLHEIRATGRSWSPAVKKLHALLKVVQAYRRNRTWFVHSKAPQPSDSLQELMNNGPGTVPSILVMVPTILSTAPAVGWGTLSAESPSPLQVSVATQSVVSTDLELS